MKQILAIGYYHHGITTLKTQKETIIMDERQANQIMRDAIKQHPAVGTHFHETVKTKSIQKKENNMRYHSPKPTLLEKIIAITFTAIMFFAIYCYFFPEQARFIFSKLFGG